MSCPEDKVLWEGKCSSGCPSGSYFDTSTNSCSYCPTSCQDCLSDKKCLKCDLGLYLSDNECLSSCPDGTYPNENSECESCSEECSICYGPTDYQCLECNSKDGFIWADTKHSKCVSGICEEGYYFYESNCVSCYKSCKSCKGLTSLDCIECKSGFRENIIESGLVCESCPEGYKIDSRNRCQGNIYL